MKPLPRAPAQRRNVGWWSTYKPAIWVLGSWAALVCAAAMVEQWTGRSIPLCMFKRVTGYPCVSCGSTRGVLAAARGDVLGALAWNPLVMSLLVLGPVVVLWRITTARRRARMGLPPAYWSPAQRAVAWVVAIALVAANWAYVVWRGN